MLTKRIIPCLDIKNGRTVKGVNFVNLKDAGGPVELAKIYVDQGADELVFLDITATHERKKTVVELAEEVGKVINIPFTIGGGISTLEDMEKVFRAGADKISINSAAIKNPEIIKQASERFGNQAIVLGVDAKLNVSSENKNKFPLSQSLPEGEKKEVKKSWNIFVAGGRIDMGLDLIEWIKKGQDLGAGEILLTSMDCDGVKDGFDIEMLKAVKEVAKIPVIASGGAGKMEDFFEIFEKNLAEAGLAASIFHFKEIEIPDLKKYLSGKGVCVRR